MRIQRLDLLKRLLSVSPGVTPTNTLQQSTCVVLQKGRLYTLNREIACSIVSNLDDNLQGAIAAKKLIELLKRLNEEVVDVEIKEGRFIVKGAETVTRLRMEDDINMRLDMVELPKEWVKLSPEFALAADLVCRCTKKKHMDFARMCVHIHPNWLEASDNNKMARWVLPTFVEQSVLIRGTTIKAMVSLGMTKACETKNWLHFKNPFGLRISLKKWECKAYPELGQFLQIRGEKVTFPKVLAEVAETAGLMLDDTDGSVKVSIFKNKAVVTGLGSAGDHVGQKTIQYDGKEMSFLIPPKLIAELVEKETMCEISDRCLRVANEQYTYVTSLEVQHG